jgi:hypothetical protein
MTVNYNILWHDVNKRPISSMIINWTLGPWDCKCDMSHSIEPEGASLGTIGRLLCLGMETSMSGLVVAEDSIAQWLGCCTTEFTALVV